MTDASSVKMYANIKIPVKNAFNQYDLFYIIINICIIKNTIFLLFFLLSKYILLYNYVKPKKGSIYWIIIKWQILNKKKYLKKIVQKKFKSIKIDRKKF